MSAYNAAEVARLIALPLPVQPYTQRRLQEQLRSAAERIERLERALNDAARIAEQQPFYPDTHTGMRQLMFCKPPQGWNGYREDIEIRPLVYGDKPLAPGGRDEPIGWALQHPGIGRWMLYGDAVKARADAAANGIDVHPLYLRPQPSAPQGELAAKYNELLYAVARKFPGESRHETALRYIRNAESDCNGPAQVAKEKQE